MMMVMSSKVDGVACQREMIKTCRVQQSTCTLETLKRAPCVDETSSNCDLVRPFFLRVGSVAGNGSKVSGQKKSFFRRKVNRPESRIVFRNSSKFVVSFSVCVASSETKKYCESQTDCETGLKRVAFLNDSFHAGVTGPKGSRSVTEIDKEAKFLMVDSRMAPDSGTRSTSVYFPTSEGSKNLRVYAFFLSDDGVWKLYKDKIYSIEGGDRMFALTATDYHGRCD